MAAKTIYCAQPFWVRGGRYVAGQPLQFMTEERAREGAQALLTGSAGVAVFSVTGHPDIDLWDEPVMLATFGDVPSLGLEEAA